MKLFIAAVVSWAAGLGVYVGVLAVVWGQRIGTGDLVAVVAWSAVATVVTVPLAYAPVMFVIRRRALRTGWSRWWVYSGVGAAIGVLPAVLVLSFWGASASQALLSPEAMLFHSMFATIGVVFGAAFHSVCGHESA